MRDFAPGATFAGYRLQALLGDGGFGEVWRAIETATGRTVALKILSGRYGSDDAERLRAEVELLAAAAVGRDPHVVSVEGGGVEPVPHIVMEYVAGESLASRLARVGHLSVPDTVRIGRAIAAALVALSRAGIVHRDLKAANVLLRTDGSTKLADFGIAKIVGFDSLTATGQLPMSLHYAAPEVWEGKGGAAADRYAYGVLLYECLAGHPPFRGGYADVFRGHRDQTPDLSALPTDTPDGLRTLIADCLAKDPLARPPDNATLQARIEAVQSGLVGVQPAHPPVAFGPWHLLEPVPTRPFVWRAERHGERATVEVVFGELSLGETLHRAVAANAVLVGLGAERLFGTNRLILRPDEAWPADLEPGGPFAFWVAREDVPIPVVAPRLDAAALERAVGTLVALRDAAGVHGLALDLGPKRVSLLPDGSVYVRRPGIPDPDGVVADPDATALATLGDHVERGLVSFVERAESLDELAEALRDVHDRTIVFPDGTVPMQTVPLQTARAQTVATTGRNATVAPAEDVNPRAKAYRPPRRDDESEPSPARRSRVLAAAVVIALVAVIAAAAIGAAAVLQPTVTATATPAISTETVVATQTAQASPSVQSNTVATNEPSAAPVSTPPSTAASASASPRPTSQATPRPTANPTPVPSPTLAPTPTQPSMPAAPSNVVASGLSANEITVTWSEGSGATGYRIKRWDGSKWPVLAELSIGTTSYINGGLAANTEYAYYVCAYNSAGESCNSPWASGWTMPAAPSNVVASGLGANEITLTWSAGSSATGYRIKRWDGSKWPVVAELPQGTTSYINGGLAANTEYAFYVCAYNGAGESCNSPWASGWTKP